MRGFVGIGKSTSVEEAVSEATQGLKNADLLILTAPFNMAEQAAALISAKYPGIPMIGATGPSLAGTGFNSDSITLVAFAGVTVTTGIIENTDTNPISFITDFENDAKAIEAGNSNTICMEFITSGEEKTLSTMNLVLSKNNIGLIGGTTYGTPLGSKPSVIYNGRLHNKSCVYAFVKNNVGKIRLYSENIYTKLSKKPHYATLVDTKTKTLFQLDGDSAFEVYTTETGCTKEEIVDKMPYFPLGRAIGDDINIVSTVSLDMNGVMFNGKAIYDNDTVYVMQLGEYQDIHTDFITNIMETSGKRSFIYGFENMNRMRLFYTEGYADEYLNSLKSLGTYACHLGDGEQLNCQHVNQTFVCAVFE